MMLLYATFRLYNPLGGAAEDCRISDKKCKI